MADHRVFKMSFPKVYGCLVAKAERKGRTREEVDQLTCWLTGYTPAGLQQQLDRGCDYATFFAEAPCLHPHRHLIQGTICGVRIEAISDPLMQQIRQLDKLVDELAKGRPVERILR